MASTQRDLIAGEVSKDLTRRVILPEKIAKAHDEGVIHFHDMDYFIQPIFNCCLINIGDMLDNGTVMNGKMIESPKSFQVACNVMTQIIASVASCQYGGQSVDVRHLGKYLRRSREKFMERAKRTMGENADPKMVEAVVDERLREELTVAFRDPVPVFAGRRSVYCRKRHDYRRNPPAASAGDQERKRRVCNAGFPEVGVCAG